MERKDSLYQVIHEEKWRREISFPAKLMCVSFLLGGLLCYFHWEAMLISYLAQRKIPLPFTNMQELYDSDHRLGVSPGTSDWDSFKYGNELWRKIYANKLEPVSKPKKIENVLMDDKLAIYEGVFSTQ